MADSSTRLEVYVNASETNARAALNGMAEAISSQIGTSRAVIHASIDLMVKNSIIPDDAGSIGKATQELMRKELSGGVAGANDPPDVPDGGGGGSEGGERIELRVTGIPRDVCLFCRGGIRAVHSTGAAEPYHGKAAGEFREERVDTGGHLSGTMIRGLIQIIIFWVLGILMFHVDLGLSPAAVIILPS